MLQKYKSHALRELAEKLVEEISERFDLSEKDRRDCPTSLVRQWITYDGHATLFLAEQQLYFVLARTPLGKTFAVPTPALTAWSKQLTDDWKISPDDLPDIFDQLNRGQSAQVTNADGLPVRLWVDPSNQGRHVEPLVKENIPPGRKRDYHKIAADILESYLGPLVDADEMEKLARSVVNQWQRHEGTACLFMEGESLVFTLKEGEAGCNVAVQSGQSHIASVLASYGIASEVIPQAIAKINLAQEIEFQDKNGVACGLWHDPKERRIRVRPINPGPPSLWHGEFTI